MNNILIVDGFIPVHIKMKELGAKLSIITETGRIKGKYPDLYFRVVEVEDEEKVFFAEKINEIDKIDAIINCSENRQYITSAIAEKLNLKYHSIDVLNKIYDKNLMRTVLNKSGLDETIGCMVNSKNEIMDFIDKYGMPIVIKPKEGVGSKGISVLHDLSDVEKSLDWYAASGSDRSNLYVEQYIEGTEYSVESFSEDGDVYIISITKKIKTEDNHCIELGQCVGEFLNKEAKNNIEKYIKRFIKLIGIDNGPSHTEIIVNSKGKIGVVETHCRLGGDAIPNLVYNAFGIDMIELWARQVMGERISCRINKSKSRYSIIYFMTSEKNGILEKIPNIDMYYDKYGEDIEFKFYKEIGEEITEFRDSYSRLGHVILTGDCFEKIINEIKYIVKDVESEIIIKKIK